MEASYPDAYSSWRIKGYDISLGQTLSAYRDKYDDTETIPGSDGSVTPDYYDAGPMSNSDRVLVSANQDQPSNREIWERSIQATILDNGTITLRHPNQDQPSNQSYIYNRVRAMIPQQPAADQSP